MKKMLFLIMLLGLNSLAFASDVPDAVLADASKSSVATSIFHHIMKPLSTVWQLLDENPLLKRQEWWGWRQKLEDKGITFTAVYTGDSVSNTSGGLKRGTAYLGNLDLTMTVDTEKVGLWKGGTFFAYGLYNFGSNLATGKYVGDMQGVDNIEAPRLFKLFELWYDQHLFNDKLSARTGLYNLNSEFNVSQYGGLFLNSSFGIEPDISANTTASIFPLTAPAFRLKWDPTEHVTLMGAVLDGDPGDEKTNPHGLNPVMNKKHGTMVVGEAQLHGDVPFPIVGKLPGSIKAGVWNNDKRIDDMSALDDQGNPVSHAGTNGFYFVVDQMLFREKDDQGLGVFGQYGQAPNNRSTINRYYGVGLNYKGLIPTRDDDTLGFAFNKAATSEDYRETGDFDKMEEVMEVTYQIQLTKSIVLQPDFQVVHNPSADPTIRDAKVITVRTKISF